MHSQRGQGLGPNGTNTRSPDQAAPPTTSFTRNAAVAANRGAARAAAAGDVNINRSSLLVGQKGLEAVPPLSLLNPAKFTDSSLGLESSEQAVSTWPGG